VKEKRKTYDEPKISFIHYAKIHYGGRYTETQVNDVIKLAKMLPIFCSYIWFWTLYMQMSTSFLIQAVKMNLKISNFTLPAASLSIFDPIIILIFSPFVDKVAYPLIKRLTGKLPSQFSRIAWGMGALALAMVVAGVLEIGRLHEINTTGGFNQTVSNTTSVASHLSVFTQIPQYLLVGCGEVLACITGLEFAFSEAPESLRGIVMGIFLCTTGVGSFLSSALLNIVNAATAPNKWVADDINKGHLDYFLFLLAALMIPNVIGFVFIAKWYNKGVPDEVREDYDPMMNSVEVADKGHKRSFDSKTDVSLINHAVNNDGN